MGHLSKIAQQLHIWPLSISSTLNDPLNIQILALGTYISPQLQSKLCIKPFSSYHLLHKQVQTK
jgi:hypothetical protein